MPLDLFVGSIDIKKDPGGTEALTITRNTLGDILFLDENGEQVRATSSDIALAKLFHLFAKDPVDNGIFAPAFSAAFV